MDFHLEYTSIKSKSLLNYNHNFNRWFALPLLHLVVTVEDACHYKLIIDFCLSTYSLWNHATIAWFSLYKKSKTENPFCFFAFYLSIL